MAVKIGFLTTLGVNVGDEFIREGIRHVLDQCGVSYAPFYVNKHDLETLQRTVEDEVCELQNKFWETDLFIQAGAPVYWHLGSHTSLTSEWHQWFWEELVFCQNPASPPPLFVNLGAGFTQAYGKGAEAFLADHRCVAFARKAAEHSLLTTVRDPSAARLLTTLGVVHHALPCPAFLAGGRHSISQPVDGLIGVNLMPLASHHDLEENFDRKRWHEAIVALLDQLRGEGSIIFVSHNEEEAAFARQYGHPGECIFQSANWRDYFDVYGHCEAVVSNRVHGAVCAAGFGVPAMIIGNDTRAEIADYVGLPRFRVTEFDVAKWMDALRGLRRRRASESERLLQHRDESMCRYRELLQPIVQRSASRPHGR